MSKIKTLVFVAYALLAVLSNNGYAIELKEGVHYEVVGGKKSQKKKIVEYFNYGCPGCYTSESFVSQLKQAKPKDVDFQAVPFENHAGWKIYVEAYYIAEMLGILDKAHGKIFHRVHTEKKAITSKDQLKELFVGLGADAKKFDQVASSFQLNTKMRKGKKDAVKQRIGGTPAYVVNDYYRINTSAFNSNLELQQAILELVNR